MTEDIKTLDSAVYTIRKHANNLCRNNEQLNKICKSQQERIEEVSEALETLYIDAEILLNIIAEPGERSKEALISIVDSVKENIDNAKELLGVKEED